MTEPGADLAVAIAIVSSSMGIGVPAEIVACGEVGLGGEIRQVSEIDRRLNEASRIGFESVVIPAKSPQVPEGRKVLRAATVLETLERTKLIDSDPFR